MEAGLIIPLYKQSEYWVKMMTGIESQSVLPKCVYVMMDRPTDEEYELVKNTCNSKYAKCKYKIFNCQKIPYYVGRPNNLPDQDLFLAGHMRNIGIEHAMHEPIALDYFVFIDGDCIPEKDLIKSHINSGNSYMPTLSCGRRREKAYDWKDQREIDPTLEALDLFNQESGYIIQNFKLLDKSAITWSCNIGLNRKAVENIRNLNKRYYGRYELFSSEFTGTWGGEDGFLGIQAKICRVLINILTEEKSGVRHIDHPRPQEKYAGESFSEYLDNQVALLDEMQMNYPLTTKFFKGIPV